MKRRTIGREGQRGEMKGRRQLHRGIEEQRLDTLRVKCLWNDIAQRTEGSWDSVWLTNHVVCVNPFLFLSLSCA